jgi:hypothetical protein
VDWHPSGACGVIDFTADRGAAARLTGGQAGLVADFLRAMTAASPCPRPVAVESCEVC